MKKNIGTPERIVRVIVGLVIIGWGIYANNWWGALGLVPLLTGIIGWCGIYQIMKESGGCCCGGHK